MGAAPAATRATWDAPPWGVPPVVSWDAGAGWVGACVCWPYLFSLAWSGSVSFRCHWLYALGTLGPSTGYALGLLGHPLGCYCVALECRPPYPAGSFHRCTVQPSWSLRAVLSIFDSLGH